MHIFEIIRILASDAAEQIVLLEPIPENTKSQSFQRQNNIHRLLELYQNTIFVIDDEEGYEGIDTWLERSGITPEMHGDSNYPLWKTSKYLSTALRMIYDSPNDFPFCKHGLKSSPEWSLVRKLALEVLHACKTSTEISTDSFEHLWFEAYGKHFTEPA